MNSDRCIDGNDSQNGNCSRFGIQPPSNITPPVTVFFPGRDCKQILMKTLLGQQPRHWISSVPRLPVLKIPSPPCSVKRVSIALSAIRFRSVITRCPTRAAGFLPAGLDDPWGNTRQGRKGLESQTLLAPFRCAQATYSFFVRPPCGTRGHSANRVAELRRELFLASTPSWPGPCIEGWRRRWRRAGWRCFGDLASSFPSAFESQT
jgi:hypothetical protein